MSEKALGPVEGPLQRARLHLRGGKRRLRQGKISAGIATFADALQGAMEWYVAAPERRNSLNINTGENLNDEKTVYAILVRSGVLDGSFDFMAFDRLVERALSEDIVEYDYRDLTARIESVMTRLGVMPFDEAALPPEDPTTF